MFNLTKKFISPMLSLSFVSVGMGLFSTAQTVWLHENHYSSLTIGLIVTAYYLGFIYAAFKSEKLIMRISHIRAFSFFAATLCTLVLVQGLFANAVAWFFIRLISGYCTAGMFVVIESWLLCQSDKKSRSSVLALYMVFYYGAQALSQFFLNMGTDEIMRLFSISALMVSLSIIPLASTTVAQPKIEIPSALNILKLFKLSPTGVGGSFFSGLIIAPIYGFLPLYFTDTYHKASTIAALMFTVIIGGMFFQIPFGKFSDIIGRRKMLILVFILLLVCAGLLLLHIPNMELTYILCFLFGGAAFAIYPISMSHACDVIDVNDMVSAAQGLVLSNSIGMVLGPLLASVTIWLASPRFGLIGYFLLLAGIMIPFFIREQAAKGSLAASDREDFVAMPKTTPMMSEIDPRVDRETHP